jgi:hypothetical protein
LPFVKHVPVAAVACPDSGNRHGDEELSEANLIDMGVA